MDINAIREKMNDLYRRCKVARDAGNMALAETFEAGARRLNRKYKHAAHIHRKPKEHHAQPARVVEEKPIET